MDLSVYDELRWPSRDELEAEEVSARPGVHQTLEPPAVLWSQGYQALARDNLYTCRLLIVSTCTAAAAALTHCFPSKQIAGTVVLPSVDLAGSSLQPSLQHPTSFMYALEGSTGPILVVVCQYKVPAEGAVGWARAVLGAVKAEHILVLSSMPAEQLRGGDDPSQTSLVYYAQTSAARDLTRASGLPPPAPYLPTGNLITGVAAAAVSHCQARGQKAEAVVAVEPSPAAAIEMVSPLAAAAAAACHNIGEVGLARQLKDPKLLSAARQELAQHSVSRHASASLFL